MSRHILLTALLGAFFIAPTHAARDDDADDVLSAALEVDDERLNAEAGLQEQRTNSNSTEEFVYVCHSFCVLCNDGKRAVYIRRSKSWMAWGFTAGAAAVATLTWPTAGAAAVAWAVNEKNRNNLRKNLTDLNKLSDVCNAVSFVPLNASGELAYGGQFNVNSIPQTSELANLTYLKKDMDLLKSKTGQFEEVFGKAFRDGTVFCGKHGGGYNILEENMVSGLQNSVSRLVKGTVKGTVKGSGFYDTCKKGMQFLSVRD